MKNTSPEVDRYIESSAEFARPILDRIRRLFHEAHPEIVETIKWGFPHFEYKGVVGSMAAFNKHATWALWKAQLLDDPEGILPRIGETSMGGTKVRDVSELPSDEVMKRYIREAVRLNEQGIRIQRPKKPAAAVEVPADFLKALERAPAAKKAFEEFSASHRREYVEWITEARQDATRQKRMTTAIEWLAEGKPRNWKYMK